MARITTRFLTTAVAVAALMPIGSAQADCASPIAIYTAGSSAVIGDWGAGIQVDLRGLGCSTSTSDTAIVPPGARTVQVAARLDPGIQPQGTLTTTTTVPLEFELIETTVLLGDEAQTSMWWWSRTVPIPATSAAPVIARVTHDASTFEVTYRRSV